ncbi:unnamed protein product [Cyclocybe aegerita]|uniref:Cytochrome P450 monooxygenase pc-3 n=1 Tax=Cyclocybe aegerita TaxID=1973307 RepID=A0A8S0XWK5_CYCAE|nr:unnamed protein product [Cyclocybe aegerita]
MAIPPGFVYIGHRLPQLLAGPLTAYFLIVLLGREISTTLTITSVLLSGPLLFTILLTYDDIKNYIAACSSGAQLPPHIRDYSLGGIWTIYKDIQAEKSGYIADGIEETVEYCGGYVFNVRLLFQNRMITLEPEHLKTILASGFEKFEKGLEFREVFNSLLGSGVFAADGDLWKFHRSMTRPFFTKDRISDFDNFEHHAEDAICQLKLRLREGYPVDIQDMAARFTLDSATEFLFGNDVRSLASRIPYPASSARASPFLSDSEESIELDPAARFAKAFSEAQTVSLSRARLGLHWPLAEFWTDRIVAPMRVVHDMIDPIVAEAIERKHANAEKKAGHEGNTLLEELVNSTEDPILLRDEIMSLLVAGRDTTASTLTFVVYMLSEYPEVLRRLREEVLSKVGPNKRPTYDDIREMKYLRAVINETLRLYPVVPFNVRMSKQATTWPPVKPGGKPFYIPANTRVAYSVMAMQRRKDLWGPDALEFDPDRFLDNRLQKYLTRNPFIFLPFNAGPRICLGQQFAYNEASFFLIRFLQNFSSITLAMDAQPPESHAPKHWASEEGRKGKEKVKRQAHLTIYMQGGLWVRMDEADESKS